MVGLSVGRSDSMHLEISHLLLVNDKIIFCDKKCKQVINLCFSAFSFSSTPYLVWEWTYLNLLFFQLGKWTIPSYSQGFELWCGFPTFISPSYQGLSLGTKFKEKSFWELSLKEVLLRAKCKEKSFWEPVIERYEKRLSGWKTKYLAKGGRLTLTKCILSNISTYFLSLFFIPFSVANKL